MISLADPLLGWIAPSLLLGLRVAPVIAYAPPFSLIPVPATIRVLMGLGLAACLASAIPGVRAATAVLTPGELMIAGLRELFVGMTFVTAFQLAYGALRMAGRTIDIQAGFGLATLIDPATRTQTPLVGTMFAYAAGAVFFAMNGHHELMRAFSASLDLVPLGGASAPQSLGRLVGFMGVVFTLAFGVAGGAILSLFLVDIGIALLSRTAPQMNVLILGFQLKGLLLFFTLPASFGFAGALLSRLMAATLQSMLSLV